MNFNEMITSFLLSESTDEKLEISKRFVQELKKYQIVIYGAGATGITLLSSLRRHSIEPLFYVDRRHKVCTDLGGVPVCSPEKLSDVDTQNTVVVMAINAEVIRKFNQEPFANVERLAPNARLIRVGVHMNSVLRFEHCYNSVSRNDVLNIVDCLDCGAETKLCPLYQEYLRKIAPGRKTNAKNCSKKFDWFGYIVGQKCTLKCKECCEHVPYLKNTKFSELETIISDCTKIAESCEFLRYIELIGGEPFLHPQFKEMLRQLLEIQNVGYIKIFSNGTIVPDEELLDILANPRIVLTISNYTDVAEGVLLKNIYETLNMLNEHKIRYVFSESKEWTAWGEFDLRGYTEDEVRNNFYNCFIANCHRVYQGILYKCPHNYAGVQRGLLTLNEGEYVDINMWNPDELAQKLDDFENIPYTEGCKRCDMPFRATVVPAGVQLKT